MACEPMMMGSPLSPSSPAAHNLQASYLPAYLMGEPTPSSSPAGRMWSGTPSSSPAKSLAFNKSISSPGPMNQLLCGQSAKLDRHRDIIAGRVKEKSGAPPVQGLLESFSTPTSQGPESRVHHPEFCTPNLPETPGGVSHTPGGMMHTPGPIMHTPGGMMHTPGGMMHTPGGIGRTPVFSTPTAGHNMTQDTSFALNHSMAKKNPTSPAQTDPFYTQGENIKSEDCLDETWVTVFGFPPAATSFILQQFSQYGNICKHVVASDGNWMHIHYQSKIQAKKALSKNGKIYGNSIMVGVTPCIDKDVMVSGMDESSMQKTELLGNTSVMGTTLNQSVVGERSRHTPIRPLTAAYKAAASDHQVVPAGSTPQKNNGVISKAMEYMFGW